MKNKKILTRLFAVLVTLLLVVTMALPCFADMQGEDVNEFLPALGYVDVDPIALKNGDVFDVNGFYQYVIYRVYEGDPETYTLWKGLEGDCCVVAPNGVAYAPESVAITWSSSASAYIVDLIDDNYRITVNAGISSSTPLYIYLRDYPPTYNVPEYNNYWWKLSPYFDAYIVGEEPIPDVSSNGWYAEIYNIIKEAVFGADTALDASQQFVLTQMATWLSYGLILLPIIICLLILVRCFR